MKVLIWIIQCIILVQMAVLTVGLRKWRFACVLMPIPMEPMSGLLLSRKISVVLPVPLVLIFRCLRLEYLLCRLWLTRVQEILPHAQKWSFIKRIPILLTIQYCLLTLVVVNSSRVSLKKIFKTAITHFSRTQLIICIVRSIPGNFVQLSLRLILIRIYRKQLIRPVLIVCLIIRQAFTSHRDKNSLYQWPMRIMRTWVYVYRIWINRGETDLEEILIR